MNQAIEGNTLSPQALSQHILLGRFTDKAFFDLNQVDTLTGDTLTVHTENGRLRVGDVRFVFKNKLARNGVVHIIYPDLE
ncbi:fasciclin domain-containing protein [Planctomycetota bacterium]